MALVFFGGGLGTIFRYLISKTFNPYFQNFYLGTFLVNVTGCLLIGFIVGFTLKSNYLSENHSLLLITGFCGGFTTFSALAFENYSLLKSGDLVHLSIYTIASIVIGVLAVSLGMWLSKLM